ncbi:unnamed protein product, partial [Polarella glacialis]
AQLDPGRTPGTKLWMPFSSFWYCVLNWYYFTVVLSVAQKLWSRTSKAFRKTMVGIAGQKTRLNYLLLAHTVVAATFGTVAFLLPHLFGFFLGEEWHGSWRFNPEEGQVKITHVVIRIYGALIVGQSLIVWEVRKTDDGVVRRAIVRAYFVVFTLTTLALLRAQLTDSTWHVANLLNLLLFGALAGFYGWFYWFNPPPVFEGLGKGEI